MSEQVDARKDRMGRKEALSLAKKCGKVIVAKGKKITTFNPSQDDPKDIAAAMLGPTGNLRAPTIQVGKTLLVGFNEEAYRLNLT